MHYLKRTSSTDKNFDRDRLPSFAEILLEDQASAPHSMVSGLVNPSFCLSGLNFVSRYSNPDLPPGTLLHDTAGSYKINDVKNREKDGKYAPTCPYGERCTNPVRADGKVFDKSLNKQYCCAVHREEAVAPIFKKSDTSTPNTALLEILGNKRDKKCMHMYSDGFDMLPLNQPDAPASNDYELDLSCVTLNCGKSAGSVATGLKEDHFDMVSKLLERDVSIISLVDCRVTPGEHGGLQEDIVRWAWEKLPPGTTMYCAPKMKGGNNATGGMVIFAKANLPTAAMMVPNEAHILAGYGNLIRLLFPWHQQVLQVIGVYINPNKQQKPVMYQLLNKIMQSAPRLTNIILGDFNDELKPPTGKGGFGLNKFLTHCGLRTARKNLDKQFTNKGEPRNRELDYIFISRNIEKYGYAVGIANLRRKYNNLLGDDSTYSDTHLPVYARFRIRASINDYILMKEFESSHPLSKELLKIYPKQVITTVRT